MEESIYKIIPEEKIIPKKAKMYKSSLPGLIPPTGSTFCLGNTPLPGVIKDSINRLQMLVVHTDNKGLINLKLEY